MQTDSAGRIFIADVTPNWEPGSIAGELKRLGFSYGRKEYGREGIWWTFDKATAAAAGRLYPLLVPEKMQAAVATATAAHEASKAADAEISIPVPKDLHYLGYQKAGIAYMQPRNHVLLGDEMGLGKTVQALGLVNLAKLQSLLVVCPASLKLNWQREAAKWLVEPHRVHVIRKSSDPLNFDSQVTLLDRRAPAPFVIVNYELLANERVRAKLTGMKWNLVVFDEAHYLKSLQAARTAHCLGGTVKGRETAGLVSQCARTLYLTGTPILNRPAELYPILAQCMPKRRTRDGQLIPWMSYRGFIARYCGKSGLGAERLDELQVRLRANCMVRRLKQDVLPDLPPKFRKVIVLQAEGAAAEAVNAERTEFSRMQGEYLALKKRVSDAKLSTDRLAYAGLVENLRGASAEMLGEIARLRKQTALAKVPSVVDHVKDMLSDGSVQKLVLFAYHHEVIDKLHEALADFGVVVVTGQTPQAHRQLSVDAFQTDPKVGIFLGNIKAAGVGITLTAASNVVFAELDWTPAVVTQAEDRCHRIGARDNVLVQHIILENSLDARLCAALVRKQQIADEALDDRTKLGILEESLNLFDLQ